MNNATPPIAPSLRPMLDKPVTLIGMMGSGKSTVGKRLAQALDLPFVDADIEIEKAAGATIPEIFAQYGEAAFRDGERRVIARLAEGDLKIIATGGGAFMQAETREILLAKTIVVWLDASLDTLVERVSRRGGRPLLEGRDPRAVLAELLAVRNPVYAKADLRIESLPQPHDVTVQMIIEGLLKR